MQQIWIPFVPGEPGKVVKIGLVPFLYTYKLHLIFHSADVIMMGGKRFWSVWSQALRFFFFFLSICVFEGVHVCFLSIRLCGCVYITTSLLLLLLLLLLLSLLLLLLMPIAPVHLSSCPSCPLNLSKTRTETWPSAVKSSSISRQSVVLCSVKWIQNHYGFIPPHRLGEETVQTLWPLTVWTCFKPAFLLYLSSFFCCFLSSLSVQS